MKKQLANQWIMVILLTLVMSCSEKHAYKALIITGQNNHNWQASSPVLKQLLDQTQLFTSTIVETPSQGKDMSAFAPEFSKYDVVVLDYNGDSWPQKTKLAFMDYVKNGGGVVVYHAADNSFADWKEYNEMIGLGGWNGRTEKDGPYIYYKNDTMITDTSAGIGGSHGMRHEFLVKLRNSSHPITKGMPEKWLHGEDELYSQLRGPAKNMEILATAFADTSKHGTGRDEPVLFVLSYGKGRIFHTTLGHAGKDKIFPSMECAGFITTFQRGAEWAASGVVTQSVPIDFPNSACVIQRSGYKPLSLEELANKISTLDTTTSRLYFVDLDKHLKSLEGNAESMAVYENLLGKILQNNSVTISVKKSALHLIGQLGTSESIPMLKTLESTAELKEEIQFILKRLEAK